MKSSKEFIERLKTDEEFEKQISEAVKGDRDKKTVVAKDYGYDVSEEDLEALSENGEVSEDDLKKYPEELCIRPMIAHTLKAVNRKINLKGYDNPLMEEYIRFINMYYLKYNNAVLVYKYKILRRPVL